MKNEHILQDEFTKNYLDKVIKNKKISHAYIFSNKEEEVLENYILTFVKSLFCENNKNDEYYMCNNCSKCLQINNRNYIDFFTIDSQNTIKKDDILKLKEDLTLKPIYSKKVYWIKNVEKMTNQAANSLLKILEEPEDDIVALLSTTNISNVLPTLVSRCQNIIINDNFSNVVKLNNDAMLHTINNFIVNYNKNRDFSLLSLTLELTTKEDISLFFKCFINMIEDNIKNISLQSYDFIDIYNNSLKSLRELELNVSPQLVLESFIINIILSNNNLSFFDKENKNVQL